MTSCDDIRIKSPKEISGKQALLMIPLTKFFCQKENITKLLQIVEGHSLISLRLIDWFVTNYSKKNNVMYNVNKYKSGKKKTNKTPQFSDYFSVFHDYKSQLKAFSKKHFDPFCRRIRIHFYYSKDSYIITTVGQLNFFKWAIESYILDYITENISDIEDDMNSSYKANVAKDTKKDDKKDDKKNDKNTKCPSKVRQKKGTKTKTSGKKKSNKGTQRKKRRELSESASKSIIKHHYPTVITFD